MKRREFIAVLGGVAAMPFAARAQQPAKETGIPVIGFLRVTSFAPVQDIVTSFRQGLKEAGLIEGQNVAIEFRSGESRNERLPALVAELVRRPVAVIVGDTISSLTAKAATLSVPIVFATGGDPVKQGLVASLNKPGGNVTGVNFFGGVLGAKRLELLRQIVPKAKTIAVLINPNTPAIEAERKDLLDAAQTVGQQLIFLDATNDHDIETAFVTIAQRQADALMVGSGAFLNSKSERIVTLAARHTLPVIYIQREAVMAGGLMSYGTSITDAYRHAGIYAGRILNGEKPADLPVMQSTKFGLLLNLKTAKALRLEIPDRLLALADEVIE